MWYKNSALINGREYSPEIDPHIYMCFIENIVPMFALIIVMTS